MQQDDDSKKRYDEISENIGKLFQWQVDHQQHDYIAFKEIQARLDAQDSNINMLPTKDEIDQIVTDSLVNFFTSKGVMSKNILVTVAVVIGSMAVIFGGFKWLLGIIGFSYLK